MARRLWEVDVTRGVAVALMIVYHFFFDLNFLGIAAFDFSGWPLLLLQRTVAVLFLSLVGVSLVLSRIRGVTMVQNVRRAAFLAVIAAVITLATWVYPHDGFIVFGIIHFIALAMLLGYLFTFLPAWLNLVAGMASVGIGFLVSSLTTETPWLLWLGVRFPGFHTLDFYPLFPWFGVVLFGIFIAKITDPFSRPYSTKAMPSLFGALDFLGRNALAVYLVHQPILFGLLFAAKAAFGF